MVFYFLFSPRCKIEVSITNTFFIHLASGSPNCSLVVDSSITGPVTEEHLPVVRAIALLHGILFQGLAPVFVQ